MIHYSVLLSESIELLNIKPDGVYVDGTFGRGGHSGEILKHLSAHGRLIAFDKDIEAINYAKEKFSDSRLTMVHDSFSQIDKYLNQMNVAKVDGVILDLGISSPQIDNANRGFSFRFDSELDMRMDNTRGQSAREWINQVDEVELARVLWQYGEEKFSRKIAKNIISARAQKEIVTTTQLAEIIAASVYIRDKGQNPATRSFQAIRIHINNELGDLQDILAKLPLFLNNHGRIVVISFHSLEDRIVKTRFNDLAKQEHLPKWVTAEAALPDYTVIAKKIKASTDEVSENSRSRSAILRCLERIKV